MLRRSAEQTGIHPLYLDMISVYCDFVRKNRLDQYSPLIRTAITYIKIHLADRLSLNKLASHCHVSPSYLSRTFNQETGMSIPHFITEKRMETASDMLTFSNMSIQDIAYYVGYLDVNYFTLCFRKIKGMPPAAYRKASAKNTQSSAPQ